jgi:hypothetical protein
MADSYWLLGLTLAAQGDLDGAQDAALHAGELARAAGYDVGVARSLECQAIIASADGQDYKAELLRRAATVLTEDWGPATPVITITDQQATSVPAPARSASS